LKRFPHSNKMMMMTEFLFLTEAKFGMLTNFRDAYERLNKAENKLKIKFTEFMVTNGEKLQNANIHIMHLIKQTVINIFLTWWTKEKINFI
jgi:hypothetical protein